MAEAAAAALWELGSAWATDAAIFVASNAAAINTVLAITATTAYAQHQRAKAQAAARAAYNASLRDRELMIRSAVAPRRKIYGRDRVSGPIVYACTSGDRNEHLHLVLALAAHECDAIETVWFNDVPLPDPDASGDILSGAFSLASEADHSYVGTTSGAGDLTLPETPSAITTCTRTASDGTGQDIVPFTWSSGTIIGGLPASTSIVVSYRTSGVSPKVRIRKYLGGAGQVADTDLIAASGGAWTSSHKGTGICYLYVRLTYDRDVFGSVGLPEIRATVRGAKLHDPRTGLAAWSDNAALIVADWLRDPRMGLGAEADAVPDAEVAASANLCDELVPLIDVGEYQRRYTFNGSITSDQAPRAALSDILSAMAGTCVWAQGRWLIRPGAYRTPALTITADHLAGSTVRVVPRASRADLFNSVRLTYRDDAQGWTEVQAPLVTNATYEAQDGGARITRTLTMASAMDSVRAQRLANIELERARQAVAVEITTNLRGYDLLPTDTFTLQLGRYGWGSGKVFEVRSRSFDFAAGTVTYQARETAAAVWDWTFGDATEVDPAPDTDLPNPYTPPDAPVISTLETGTAHLLPQADGTLITRAWVAWAALTDRFVVSGGTIQLQWRESGSTVWVSEPDLPGAATGAYIANLPDGKAVIVRVRAVNTAGRASVWDYEAERVVGKTAAPSNVASAAVAVSKGRAVWVWAVPADADWDVIEIRSADSNWGSLSVPALFRGRASQWAEVVTATGTLTRYMRHLDTSGNPSASTATVSTTVAAGDLVQDGATGATGAAGTNSATVYLFQRTSSATPPAVPSGTVTYTFASGVATGIGSWAQTLGTSGGSYRWLITATASGTGSTDTIATGEWGTPALLSDATGALAALDQVDTVEIVVGAATDLYQDTYSHGGSAFTSRTFTYTPSVDCTIDFTAKVTASQVYPDAGHFLRWYYAAGAGSDVLIGACNTTSNAKQDFAAVASFAATGGVTLTLKLLGSVPFGDPAIQVWDSIMRVTAIKR